MQTITFFTCLLAPYVMAYFALAYSMEFGKLNTRR